MRLLNTKTCELYEQFELPDKGKSLPPYAILSHTWLEEGPEGVKEVTYQDMKNSFLLLKHGSLKREGWLKLVNYCNCAAEESWEWAWMDTCCIDKTNPSDTQEAINAMFRWYQNAGVCYAYLSDVGDGTNSTISGGTGSQPSTTSGHLPLSHSYARRTGLKSSFMKATWFTRGWTLQELLASHYLIFVDQAWRRIGSRESWATEIEDASGIATRYLTGFIPTDFKSSSIAMRLSWASRRQTTLEEDETYSLLGLFGISLPLIYGEGRQQAFNRFQRELITFYDDDSIFAWKCEESFVVRTSDRTIASSGSEPRLLARFIQEFQHASNIEYSSSQDRDFQFSMTNRGLNIQSQLWGISSSHYRLQYVMRLNCTDAIHEGTGDSEPRRHRIGILLTLVNATTGLYERTSSQLVYTGIDNTETPGDFVHWIECLFVGGDTIRTDLEQEILKNPIFIGTKNIFIGPGRSRGKWWVQPKLSLKCSERIKIGPKYEGNIGRTGTREITLEPWISSSGEVGEGGEHGETEFDMVPDKIYFIELQVGSPTMPELGFVVAIELMKQEFPIAGIRKRSDLNYTIRAPWEAPHTNPSMDREEMGNDVVCVHLRPRQSSPSSRIDSVGNAPEEVTTVRKYVLEIVTEESR